jgi:hypothetical protein
LLLGLGGCQLGVGLLRRRRTRLSRRRPRTWLGSGSPFLKLAVSSDCIDSRIAAAELFFDSRARERHHRLRQALLERGHLIVLVQGGLHVLAKLEPRELPLDLIDRVFQILAVLNVLEERSSQPLPGVEDRAADDPVPGLLCRRALEAALPLLPLRNEAADDGILIDGQGFLGREFLWPVRIDLASHLTGRPH